MRITRLIPLILLATLVLPAAAESVKLTCTAPTTRLDGTPLTQAELATYTFYRGTTVIATMAAALGCGWTYPIPAGTCVTPSDKFTATATDTGIAGIANSARISPVSDPASPTAQVCSPKSDPAAPSGLGITITK